MIDMPTVGPQGVQAIMRMCRGVHQPRPGAHRRQRVADRRRLICVRCALFSPLRIPVDPFVRGTPLSLFVHVRVWVCLSLDVQLAVGLPVLPLFWFADDVVTRLCLAGACKTRQAVVLQLWNGCSP